MDFVCKRCGHKATTKCNLKHHLTRKTLCEPKLNDVPIEELLMEVTPVKKEKKYICECGHQFASRQGLYLHRRGNACKAKNVSDNESISSSQLIEELQRKVKVLEDALLNGRGQQPNHTQTTLIPLNR